MNLNIFECSSQFIHLKNVDVAGDFFPEISIRGSLVYAFSYNVRQNKTLKAPESKIIYDVLLFINGVIYTTTTTQTIENIEKRCYLLKDYLGF